MIPLIANFALDGLENRVIGRHYTTMTDLLQLQILGSSEVVGHKPNL